MDKWLDRLSNEQRARFLELGDHITLVMLAKFCEDEGLELPDIALDAGEIKKS